MALAAPASVTTILLAEYFAGIHGLQRALCIFYEPTAAVGTDECFLFRTSNSKRHFPSVPMQLFPRMREKSREKYRLNGHRHEVPTVIEGVFAPSIFARDEDSFITVTPASQRAMTIYIKSSPAIAACVINEKLQERLGKVSFA